MATDSGRFPRNIARKRFLKFKPNRVVSMSFRSTGAEMVSRYCQEAGDWKGAIEFMLMGKRTADAFSLAKSHGQMDIFTKVNNACSKAHAIPLMLPRFLLQFSLGAIPAIFDGLQP